MPISRNQLVKELEPGLNALFGLEYARYENQHEAIYDIETSDRAFEEEVMLSGFGSAQVKPEGTSVNFDDATESFTARYTHETIALAFAITEEAVEDNLYDRISSRYTKALARSMSNTKQVKAVIDISLLTDDRGLKIALNGRKLIIPVQLQFVAERLMKSNLRTATSDNDINAVASMGMLPEGYVVNNYLTDTDAFFIKTDAPNGMKMFQRAPITTKMEGDFETGNVKYKARERYSFGFSDFRGIFGSPGA
jgi:hypothetical protein